MKLFVFSGNLIIGYIEEQCRIGVKDFRIIPEFQYFEADFP